MEDTTEVVAPKPNHNVTIRICTEDVPNLNRIMTAAAKLGTVKGVAYDTYEF